MHEKKKAIRMQREDILKYCYVLFEPAKDKIDSSFIKSINIDYVKTVFRKKAFKYHPDFYCSQPKELIEQKKGAFYKIS